MVRSKSKKTAKAQVLLMAGIPVNRPFVYEKPFFKEAAAVLQGLEFPLKSKRYKAGKVKLAKAARKFGASGRGLDVRSISYAGDRR